MRLTAAFFALFASVVAAMAADTPCPAPKPLTCAQLLDLAPRRCAEGELARLAKCPSVDCGQWCSKFQPAAICSNPCPPGLTEDDLKRALAAAVPAPATFMAATMEPVAKKASVRPLLGGGIDYFHGFGAHIFTGLQAPPDKHGGNWQWQIGGSYIPQNGAEGTIPYCKWKVPYAVEPVDPWGVSTSAVYVF